MKYILIFLSLFLFANMSIANEYYIPRSVQKYITPEEKKPMNYTWIIVGSVIFISTTVILTRKRNKK